MIDNMAGNIKLSADDIVFLCDRHKGIGADGVILVEQYEGADCFMNYYNADGTMAEMCGNGVRCVAKFFLEKISPHLESANTEILNSTLCIATRAGIKEIAVNSDGTFSVNMGQPVFEHSDFPSQITLENLEFYCVGMGNPHAVSIVEDLSDYNIGVIGPKIENNKNFPNKINMELVQVLGNDKFKLDVWERGCGATLACGTGACAALAVLNQKGFIGEKEVEIQLPGGNLFLLANSLGEIILRGHAAHVFDGSF